MASQNDALSPAKLLANFLNAQLSTGPNTAAGKAKSRMNALRHGLTGQFYVMNEPDRLAYNAFEKDLLADLAPVGANERQLAVTLAQNNWRLNRARAIESNLEGLGHLEYFGEIDADTAEVEASITQAKTWLNHHPAMSNLTLYENRIERMIVRAEKRLKELQATRQTFEAKALEEAELLLRHSIMKRERVDPAKPIEVRGFEFSPSKVLATINRKLVLTSARFYKENGWDARKTFSEPMSLSFTVSDPLPKAA